ncbi:MAG TPA: TonB-dependent receptor plug domain-containing protein, partial [Bacteroidales bacterium]|nr:TonB-dependent receptor plug domain-containing protein [Bacteroidales bacterium]
MIYKWWKFFFLFYFIIFKIIAQTDTITLPTTEIKAPKSYDSITYSIKTIQIISKEDIEKAPIYHINDLLDYSQSIDMRERGTMGIQGDISIRGGSFEQTIIMLNGFIMNNPQTGHHSLDIPINIDNIEKIEIINNSLARAYGVNAYAGAINIITKPSKTNKLQISAAGGEYGWYSGKISLSLNKNKTKNLISLSNMSSDGYIKNTDFYFKNIYTQNNISFNKFNLNIETGISDKNFGA